MGFDTLDNESAPNRNTKYMALPAIDICKRYNRITASAIVVPIAAIAAVSRRVAH